MVLTFTSRVIVPPDVMIQELQGESVLLNVRTGKYFGLNPVGTRMWAAMTAAPSIQAAHAELLKEFDVAEERLRQDMLELVRQLIEHELVAAGDEPPA